MRLPQLRQALHSHDLPSAGSDRLTARAMREARPPDERKRRMDVSGEFPELNEAVREIWDRNADFWNERMGDGNEFHRVLIGPAQERLLDLRPGESVLDIGCGNGQFTRRLAQLGARVLAFD